MMDRPIVVAGNGTSIAKIAPGRIIETDFIIRTNNFFFEPEFYLGRRVDMAFMSGDPRVAPFMFETLYQCINDYDLRSWSTQDSRIIRAGNRRFAPLFTPMTYRDQRIEQDTKDLMTRFDRKPTTGIFAVLMAHAMGAKEIIIAGMDLYSTARRYAYELGPHYQALMGKDLAERRMDTHLHNPELDLAILRTLSKRGDVKLWRSAEDSTLADVADIAPIRDGTPITALPRKNPPKDWVSRTGIYSIEMLKMLRRASAVVRAVQRKGRSL